MPCDESLEPNETILQRKTTIKEKVEKLSRDLASGKVTVKIGPQGAVAFIGWTDRGPVTDVCALRKVLASGSALAKLAITKAEILAGRKVSKEAIAAGIHYHEGTGWHGKD